MSLFLLDLPSRIRLRIIQKLQLEPLCRLRRSCRALDSFVDENADRIRIRSEHILTISTGAEQNSFKFSAGIPTNYREVDDPLVQFQCTYFVKIFMSVRPSEHALLRREWNPRLNLQCKLLRVDFDYENERVWEIVGDTFKQYEKLCLNDCLPSFFEQVSEHCTEIIADYSMQPLEDVRVLTRFKLVFIDNYMFGKDDHKSFERCLRTLAAGGSGRLENLELPNTNEGKFDLEFPDLDVLKLFEPEVKPGELGNTFHILDVGTDKYALIDIHDRAYHLSFVLKEIDQLILVIYTRLEQNILLKKRIPMDFSNFYEKLVAAERNDYCTIVSELCKWYFEAVTISWQE